jgi:uncharacterized protein (TIGR02246 family)
MSSTLSEADLELFRALRGPWNRAWLERDWDAMLDLCTDDMVFMPPGEQPVSGEGLRPWCDAFPTMKSIDWEIEHAEMAGDLAVLRGPVTLVLEKDGETINFNGKYCDVLRRGEDGTWRFACIIWNES